jgi:hypothetical protein
MKGHAIEAMSSSTVEGINPIQLGARILSAKTAKECKTCSRPFLWNTTPVGRYLVHKQYHHDHVNSGINY